MADKRHTRQQLRQLQRIKTWQLLILLVLALFVSATFLRLNNIGMVQRRDAVLSADAQGDTEIIQDRLYDLQRYVSSRMNTSTGTIYLEESYTRESERLKDQAQAANTSSGENIYQRIDEEICGPQARANNWRWPDARYTSCIMTELEKYPEAEGAIDSVELPPVDLYSHSFVSPRWSPDFAGFSLLMSGFIVVMIIARLLGLLVLRLLLRRHYQDV